MILFKICTSSLHRQTYGSSVPMSIDYCLSVYIHYQEDYFAVSCVTIAIPCFRETSKERNGTRTRNLK